MNRSPDIAEGPLAPVPEVRRPGRPRRVQTGSAGGSEGDEKASVDESTEGSHAQAPKRGRGRPKRTPDAGQTQTQTSPGSTTVSPNQQGKKRGRKPKGQKDQEPESSSNSNSGEIAAGGQEDNAEELTTHLNRSLQLGGEAVAPVVPMEVEVEKPLQESSLFSSVLKKSEQPFGGGGGIPGLDLDECDANSAPPGLDTPFSLVQSFGFNFSSVSIGGESEYKSAITTASVPPPPPIVLPVLPVLPPLKTEEMPKKTEEGEGAGKEEANTEENDSSKVRRSSRIKTLEEQRGHRGRRREVVSSLADTSGLSRSSLSLQEDDSNSNSSMNMQFGSCSSGYSSPTREGNGEGGMVNSGSVPNLSSLSLGSSGGNGAKPLKVKSRWRYSLDAESMKSFEMTEGVPRSSYDMDAVSKIHNFVPPEKLVRRRGHLAFDGTDDELLEKLKKFEGMDESIYRTERKINKESKGMQCDCYLSNEEMQKGEVGCGEDCLNRLLMVECGNKCPTGNKCSNKRFQRKEYTSLEVFKTEKKGHGLRTLQHLPEGGFVIEYVGEVLDVNEFERRTSEYAKGNHEHFYFMALKSDAIIDATLRGNCSRFINHSCEPNCETQKWTVNGEVRIGFFAITDLQPGDEITFDYQFQRYGKKAQKCYCMTESCRGWIGEEDEDGEGMEDKEEVTTESEVVENKAKPRSKMDRKKRKNIQLEDMGFREELAKLEGSGLKNRHHTLTLSRLMVRAESWDDRERLLKVLIKGDTPCRRLFLDYHGLRLIWSWMVDLPLPQEGEGPQVPQLIRNDVYHMLFLQALQSLPIPNKNLLLDSKVLSLVEKWCAAPHVTTTVTLVKQQQTEIPSEPVAVADVAKENEPEIKSENEIEMKMDTSESKEEPTSTAEGMQEVTEEKTWSFVPFSKTLLESWADLKEVFRIPKKERVEQMKEHEREADKAQLASSSHSTLSSSSYDRDHRNKQFRSRGERRVPVLDPTQPQFHRHPINRMALPPGVTKEEFRKGFELSVRMREEQEMLRKQQDALVTLHQERCALVGLDPATTPIVDPHGIHYLDPKSVMWKPINIEDPSLPSELIKFVQLSQYPPVSEASEPQGDPTVEPEQAFPPWPEGLPPPPPLPPQQLPPNWKMAVDDECRCYYYHIRTRVTRWAPPNENEESESEESSGCTTDETEEEEEAKGSPSLTKASIQTWRTKLIERTARRKKSGLVQERIISPRGDDEKGFSKEMVKENKKKVLEEKRAKLLMMDSTSNDDEDDSQEISTEEKTSQEIVTEEALTEEVPKLKKKSVAALKKRRKEKPRSSKSSTKKSSKHKSKMSSEENPESSSPIETELDLTLSQQNLDEETEEFFSKVSTGPNRIISSTPSMDVVMIPGLGFDTRDLEAKRKADRAARRHAEKKKELALKKKHKDKITEPGSSSASDKRVSSKEASSIKDVFRNSVATVVVAHLNPYRKSEHIKTTDDFKHLARKITHAIVLKELKHTRDVTSLEVTESVKHKTKEYIRKFMARFPNGVYERSPENSQK